MRIIALRNLKAFWEKHPEAKPSLEGWVKTVLDADWTTPSQAQSAFAKAKALNGDRVRFEVNGGDYRMIASFDFDCGTAFVTFLGTHTGYDRINALTIAKY